MFDIGFWELLLIGVIMLLVVGPERLPSLARTAGMWMGRFKRMVGSVKSEIEEELRAEELKRMIDKNATNNSLHEIVEETRETVQSIEKSFKEEPTGEPSDPPPSTSSNSLKHD